MRRLAVLVSVMAWLTASSAFGGPRVQVGDKAPEVSAPSWLNLPKGMKAVSSNALKGKVLFVEFWATW